MSSVKEREDILKQISISYNSVIHKKRYEIVKNFALGKVLDVGCGLGYGSEIIKNTTNQIIGIDIDKESIDYARKNYGDFANFLVYDGKKIPFPDEHFDLVCSLEVIEHIDKNYHEAFYNEIKRVLKKGGILVISTPNRNFFIKKIMKTFGWKNPYHKYEYSLSEFENFLFGDPFIILLKKYYLGFFLQFSSNPFINLIYKLPPFIGRYKEKIINIDLKMGSIFPSLCNCLLYIQKKTLK